MAEEPAVPETKTGVPGLPADWALQGTDKVIDLVDTVRAKTTGPAIGISRKVVYGMVAGLLALVLLPLVIIFIIRLAASLIPVWSVYGILGIIFLLVGFLLWRKRPSGVATPAH